MRIYYFVSGATERIQKIHHHLYDLLIDGGIDVFSNVDFFHTGHIPEQDMARMQSTGEFFLGKMHGVIIEGSQFASELGYILALALSHRRPLLYLQPQTLPMQEMLERVLEEHRNNPLIFLEHYQTQEELQKRTEDFLSQIEVPTKKERSNIKFTLRISRSMDNYLNWKSKNERLTKANFLRKKILDPMREKDVEYQTKSFS